MMRLHKFCKKLFLLIFLIPVFGFVVCKKRKEVPQEEVPQEIFYPKIEEKNVSRRYVQGKFQAVIIFSTSDTITEVAKYYLEKLLSYGWVVLLPMFDTDVGPIPKKGRVHGVFKKGERILNIRMRYDSSKKKTLVDLLLRF